MIIRAIEQALLVAYHRTEGAHRHARVELDRKTGHVVVWAREDAPLPEGERGEPGPEFDDTPDGFGRIAASTARQVIVQRLRDVEDEQVLGEFRGREGDIVAGVIQQGRDPRNVLVDLGTVEGILPQAEQVPGEKYVHGERLRCFVVSVRKGAAGPADRPVPDPPQPGAQAVRARGAGDRRRHASRSRRWPARRGTAPRSRCSPPCPGSTPRAPASARWASGCAR